MSETTPQTAPKIDLTRVALDDPEAAAEAAGLRYVLDEEPGIRRRRCGRGFTYLAPDGETVRDPAERRRFAELAIPPAWTEVWICRHPDGHLQATGRDDRGRKQYRYHPRWREVRDAAKFLQMVDFGEALPALRRRVDDDLDRRGLPREKVLAALVRLLEASALRVGNEEYAKENGSFGLTTLRKEHAEVRGGRLVLRFPGKGGKEVEARVRDRRLARIVERCLELPGEALFQSLDGDGEPRPVDSTDVNDYLREIAGEDVSAKDFRTWRASVDAFEALREACDAACGAGNGDASEARKAAALRVVDRVAESLGNTRAVCREFYIHPDLLSAFEAGTFLERLRGGGSGRTTGPRTAEGLTGAERDLLRFLRAAG
ncbi:MAG TPA: DNA topoisomerase IB [Thermoanaerobaculia bacterium]|nr:DNA topoisomerase IB [Thermoanaerobaculia bacterium]